MDWSAVELRVPLSLPDRLSVDLERLILEGQLQPGSRLPAERMLAEQLGVSRTSLRDALRELENRGLVDRRRGRGTVVLAPGSVDGAADAGFGVSVVEDPSLVHILELRTIIEPPIAALTARRATRRDIEQLRELVVSMEGAVTSARYGELDRSFHQAVAQYAHNPLLALLNDQIAAEIAPIRAERYQTPARRAASARAHRRIFEAIARGDADAAEAEARKHLLTVGRDIASVRAVADKNKTKGVESHG